ncbi:hypothetical protein BD289DRAFT_30722 [Coniella lustricola]|uniref:Uncharacterized protein n=1 Tax=Coniella lustricola TaxID=2025994 RepID=A0A2T3A2X6_9PEZI|nr:hypothetical protein BD289DRAFT_30722 [Coniella lustricola]
METSPGPSLSWCLAPEPGEHSAHATAEEDGLLHLMQLPDSLVGALLLVAATRIAPRGSRTRGREIFPIAASSVSNAWDSIIPTHLGTASICSAHYCGTALLPWILTPPPMSSTSDTSSFHDVGLTLQPSDTYVYPFTTYVSFNISESHL